jgi:hypothetical protein
MAPVRGSSITKRNQDIFAADEKFYRFSHFNPGIPPEEFYDKF